MKKYKLILFDADGTLFDFHQGERDALRAAFEHHGMMYEQSVHLPLYQKINLDIWLEFEQHKILAADLSRERFRRFLFELQSPADPEKFSAMYLKGLSQSTHTIDHAREVVERLANDFTLVILTNGLSGVQHPRFKKSPMYPYFSSIVVSEDLGVAKPHPGIFEHALASVGHTDRSTAIIVGDNLSSDIQGGVNFGIDTCWFNPNRKVISNGLVPTYEIASLKQLFDILYEPTI